MTPEELKPIHDKLQEGLEPNEIAIREGIIVNVGSDIYDSYPRYGYQFFCWRSPEMVVEMDTFIKYAKGKKFFWDCGAFHGIFSFVFLKLNPESWCIAFEPNQDAFDVLMKTSNRITGFLATPMAIGNKNGKIKMREEGGHFVADENGTLESIVCQGDIFANRFSEPPDLLKIDVEGFEYEVLEGLYGIISRYKPIIFLELHLNWLSDKKKKQIIFLINEWKYRVLNVQDEREIPIDDVLTKTGELRVILV